MLTEEEKLEIEKEISGCYVKEAGKLEALKAIQKLRRWISDETLRDIADYLNISPDELDSVATFYNMIFRKPVGRHLILICDSIACWIMGGVTIADYLYGKLNTSPGQMTFDGRFTILPNSCFGACDKAPAIIIDDELYTNLTPDKLDAILKKYK